MSDTPLEPDWFGEHTATFGDRLAGARDHAGLSQEALADRIGVTTATLAAWEDDHKDPRANRLQMLAGMLGVSLSWLLTGRGDGPQAPVDRNRADPTVVALLDDMRKARSDIAVATERLGRLEQRLRRAVGEG